jgi:hypothetical protein
VADSPANGSTRQIQRWRANHFDDFVGATLDLRVPFREPVINQLLQDLLLPRAPALRSADVRIGEGNHLTVTVASARWLWLPPISVPLTIESDLLAAPSPALRLRVAGRGVAASLAPLLRFVNLPAGVVVRDRLIEIDLLAFVPEPDRETIRTWLDGAHLSTTADTLWLEMRLA